MRVPKFIILIVTIAILLVVNLFIGSVRIPMVDVYRIITGGESNEIWTNIIFSSRLPQALTAIVAGAGLAVSGLQMQTVFRNPLAGPSVLGISCPRCGFCGIALRTNRRCGFITTGLSGRCCHECCCHHWCLSGIVTHSLDIAKSKRQCHLINYWCHDRLSGQCDYWRTEVLIA